MLERTKTVSTVSTGSTHTKTDTRTESKPVSITGKNMELSENDTKSEDIGDTATVINDKKSSSTDNNSDNTFNIDKSDKIAFYDPKDVYNVFVSKLKELKYNETEFSVDNYIKISEHPSGNKGTGTGRGRGVSNQLIHKKRNRDQVDLDQHQHGHEHEHGHCLSDALNESNKKTTQENQFSFSFY